jgi:hypothetical protein
LPKALGCADRYPTLEKLDDAMKAARARRELPRSPKKKDPALRRDLPLLKRPELAVLAVILLLLARLVAAALLLLAGLLPRLLLARILGLLAWLLIGIVHSGSPLLNTNWE